MKSKKWIKSSAAVVAAVFTAGTLALAPVPAHADDGYGLTSTSKWRDGEIGYAAGCAIAHAIGIKKVC